MARSQQPPQLPTTTDLCHSSFESPVARVCILVLLVVTLLYINSGDLEYIYISKIVASKERFLDHKHDDDEELEW